MDSTTHSLIESLHQARYQCVLALTGGGTAAAAQVLGVPGGSHTVLEVVVPYGEQALSEFVGRRPEHFCSTETSQDLAIRAYERACWLAPGEKVVGLGCTASLATDRPKRGDHRFHVSCCQAERVSTYSLTLTKGARDRTGEEDVLDRVILNALGAAFQVFRQLDLPLRPDEQLHVEHADRQGLAALCTGSEVVCVTRDGQVAGLRPETKPAALLSGAFNPIHEGHWSLAEIAERSLGMPVEFELSIENVDKPLLSLEEARRRLEPFCWKAAVWLTRAPTFVEKSRLFPGAVFVVGADTAERIIAPRYYAGGEFGLRQGLTAIRERGCRFLAAGRVDRAGKYVALGDLQIPVEFRELFTGIPRSEFQMEVSSTDLRARLQKDNGITVGKLSD